MKGTDTGGGGFQLIAQRRRQPLQSGIDLGARHDLTGFVYLPRNGGSNGTIADYELQGSSDGATFRSLATGTFGNIANNPTARTVRFAAPAEGVRYVRLIARREASGKPWASVAELSVLVK